MIVAFLLTLIFLAGCAWWFEHFMTDDGDEWLDEDDERRQPNWRRI